MQSGNARRSHPAKVDAMRTEFCGASCATSPRLRNGLLADRSCPIGNLETGRSIEGNEHLIGGLP